MPSTKIRPLVGEQVSAAPDSGIGFLTGTQGLLFSYAGAFKLELVCTEGPQLLGTAEEKSNNGAVCLPF